MPRLMAPGTSTTPTLFGSAKEEHISATYSKESIAVFSRILWPSCKTSKELPKKLEINCMRLALQILLGKRSPLSRRTLVCHTILTKKESSGDVTCSSKGREPMTLWKMRVRPANQPGLLGHFRDWWRICPAGG